MPDLLRVEQPDSMEHVKTTGDFRRDGEADQEQSFGEMRRHGQKTSERRAVRPTWTYESPRRAYAATLALDLGLSHFGIAISGSANSLPISALSSPTFFL